MASPDGPFSLLRSRSAAGPRWLARLSRIIMRAKLRLPSGFAGRVCPTGLRQNPPRLHLYTKAHTLRLQLSNHWSLEAQNEKKMGNFQPTSLAVNSSTSAPPPRCSAASPQPPLTPPGVRFFYYVLRSLVTQPPISPSALPSPASLPGFLCSRRRRWSCTRGVRRIARLPAPAARTPFLRHLDSWCLPH
jgi:hypothetical protein